MNKQTNKRNIRCVGLVTKPVVGKTPSFTSREQMIELCCPKGYVIKNTDFDIFDSSIITSAVETSIETSVFSLLKKACDFELAAREWALPSERTDYDPAVKIDMSLIHV